MGESRDSKKDKPATRIRRIVAENLELLIAQTYADLPNKTARYKKLARAVNTTLSQVQRTLACKIGTTVDFLEWYASELGVAPHDLLTPNFAARKYASLSGTQNVTESSQERDPLQRGAD